MRDTKRPELAFEIARRLPHLRFVMIGGNEIGRGREYFDKVAVLARDVPNVEFVGFVPYSHVDQYFNGARILLNTSLFEGFPNTFLQAWSRGLPTVCFIDPESREEGERVTETVSDVDDACARVERLMSDDIAWQRSSERCLRHFKRVHSVEAMLAAYEPILASLGGRLR
jgi:glycosyltransferase involved in cell wall biosynthesis